MVVRYGGKGPGHISRWPKAVTAGSPPPPSTYKITLEDDSGSILQEDGSSYILLESAP